MSPPEAHRPTARDAAALRAIDAAVRSATGHEAFPAAVTRAVAVDPTECLVAIDPDGAAAAVLPSDSFGPSHRQLAVGLAPDATPDAAGRVLTAVLAAESRELVAWLPGTDPRVLAVLEAIGFDATRRQFQMRVALPVSAPSVPIGVVLRAFVVGRDEDAWIAVNNRAFANHPDQGGWVRSRLERRMAEPWFDPRGFLLAEEHGVLRGFCWTKVHEDRVGEIFVIGVDPDAHRAGLGRALVLAGLADLHGRRGCETAMLYVAADNGAAIALYESIGFTISRTDTALRRPAPR